jgi:hypothetical protein
MAHMLNVILELIQPDQNDYYNSNISASHKGLRLSVEDYSTFKDTQEDIMKGNQLQTIGDSR